VDTAATDPPPAGIRRVSLWSLREDVLVEANTGEDSVLVLTRWGEIRVDSPGPAAKELLRRMSFGPVSLENVLGAPAREPAAEELAQHKRLHEVLDQLQCAVVRSLGLQNAAGPLLSVVPIARQATFDPPELDSGQVVRLSRFAALRVGEAGMLLESPLALHRVVLHRAVATWVVGSLGRPTTPAATAAALHLAEPVALDLVSYLVAAGMVVLSQPGALPATARFAEDSDPVLMPWSHHDLLFHSRSRLGRHDDPHGAVFPYAERLPPEPAVKPPPAGPRLPLYRPALADVLAADPKLTAVVEARRSFHEFGPTPVTAEQIGELLYRTARIRSLRPGPGAPGETPYVISDRPYPTSGGLHELELYLTIDRCTGLARGIYHYDPLEHGLTLVNENEDDLSELLDAARVSAGMTAPPPVLLTMTARFRRVSWMHSGLAYATSLKHVGVLQQTLYLVATAMRLAPCAIAGGDSDAAARAFRLDWRAESSVGEFIVGSPPEKIIKSTSSDTPVNDPWWAGHGMEDFDPNNQ